LVELEWGVSLMVDTRHAMGLIADSDGGISGEGAAVQNSIGGWRRDWNAAWVAASGVRPFVRGRVRAEGAIGIMDRSVAMIDG
jgi:hypothetical protein